MKLKIIILLLSVFSFCNTSAQGHSYNMAQKELQQLTDSIVGVWSKQIPQLLDFKCIIDSAVAHAGKEVFIRNHPRNMLIEFGDRNISSVQNSIEERQGEIFVHFSKISFDASFTLDGVTVLSSCRTELSDKYQLNYSKRLVQRHLALGIKNFPQVLDIYVEGPDLNALLNQGNQHSYAALQNNLKNEIAILEYSVVGKERRLINVVAFQRDCMPTQYKKIAQAIQTESEVSSFELQNGIKLGMTRDELIDVIGCYYFSAKDEKGVEQISICISNGDELRSFPVKEKLNMYCETYFLQSGKVVRYQVNWMADYSSN